MFIEMLFKMLLLKGGVLIYAEHCTLYIHVYTFISEKKVFTLSLLRIWRFVHVHCRYFIIILLLFNILTEICITFFTNTHFIAKSIGSPWSNVSFDYFSHFHKYKS